MSLFFLLYFTLLIFYFFGETMPARFAPKEPTPPPPGSAPSKQQRYRKALSAWFVGQVLREYAASLRVERRRVADEISLMPSPRFEGTGGRRYGDDGAPRTMEDVCDWIDRQAKTVKPIGDAYKALQASQPQVARVVWLRHVELYSLQEIAAALNVSSRTIIRMLAAGHLWLTPALYIENKKSGKTARKAQIASERMGATTGEDTALSPDEIALAGFAPKTESKHKK